MSVQVWKINYILLLCTILSLHVFWIYYITVSNYTLKFFIYQELWSFYVVRSTSYNPISLFVLIRCSQSLTSFSISELPLTCLDVMRLLLPWARSFSSKFQSYKCSTQRILQRKCELSVTFQFFVAPTVGPFIHLRFILTELSVNKCLLANVSKITSLSRVILLIRFSGF